MTATPQLIGEFTAALRLHYGPGPHPDGSPQQVHGGGQTAFDFDAPAAAIAAREARIADFLQAHPKATRATAERIIGIVDEANRNPPPPDIPPTIDADIADLFRRNVGRFGEILRVADFPVLRRMPVNIPHESAEFRAIRRQVDQLDQVTVTPLRLHYGPGPHPDGSPQSVHAGGAAIPGPARGGKPAFIERGEAAGLQRQLAGGGFSYQPVANRSPAAGFMVSPYQDREYKLPGAQVSARNLTAYLTRNADLLARPDHYIGGWLDGGTAYIDIAVHTATADQARQLAQQHRQLAFYDLAKGATVRV